MEEKIFLNKTIEAKPFYLSSVEIIIPFYNEQAKVINLVNDIFNTVQKNRYIITLVDDGSVNKSFVEQLQKKKVEGLRFLKNDKCKGFGASVNNALNNPFRKDIPFVAILHSDVRVQDQNWLFNLGQSLAIMKENNVKMVSAMTDNPTVDSSDLKAKKGQTREDKILEDSFLPMYCVLANRELFNRVGFLHECPYAGVETEEFAIRMEKSGYKQGVCGKSWVQHEGRGTLKQLDKNKKAQEILLNVRSQFDEIYKNNQQA